MSKSKRIALAMLRKMAKHTNQFKCFTLHLAGRAFQASKIYNLRCSMFEEKNSWQRHGSLGTLLLQLKVVF